MQILSLHLKNIKTHRELELHFAPGINVLAGPNGIGKSTVFEAIGYALFGVDAQNFVGNVERFVSIGARRGEVTVIFEVDEGRFRVSRTAGTPANWLLAREVGGRFEVEEHKDIRETEARLRELLGLAGTRSLAEQFELVIGPFQHDFLGPFVIRQPTRRRDRFDEILGIDTWRKTFEKTKTLASAIRAKIDNLASALVPLTEQVSALPASRNAHSEASEQLATAGKELQARQRTLKDVETRLQELDSREQAIRALEVEVDRLRERIANGQEKIAGQKARIAEAEASRRILAENEAGKQAWEEAAHRLGELRRRLADQRRLEQEVAGLEKRLATLDERLTAERQGIEQTARDLDAEEARLGEQHATLAVDEQTEKLAARLPSLREQSSALQQRIGELDGRKVSLEEGREKLAEGICPFFREPCQNIADRPPADAFSDRLSALEREREQLAKELAQCRQQETEASRAIERLKALEGQRKALEAQAETIARRRRENSERTAALETIRRERQQVQDRLTEKQQALQAFSRLQAEIEAAEAEQKRHQAARDRYLAHMEQAARLEDLQAELARFEQLLAGLRTGLAEKEQSLATARQGYDADRHRELRQQKDGLRQEIGALGQKIEGLRAEVDRLAGEIERLRRIEQEIAEKQAQIKAWRARGDLVKFLRNRVFRQVSTHLSERFREEISQRANRIYRIIAEEDEELVWGENYRIVLRDMQDGTLRERTDDQLSGGQTMSAVVALRLAMLQTIGARIAFFDEPTSNLDAARRENLARAFRAIDTGQEDATGHWYDQLFLISHDVAFSEITDQLIDLERNGLPE